MDVQRLLEKYFSDMRHVETERHWFLGAYSVVIAGTLAFLAQDDSQFNHIFAYAGLVVLSFIGFLHALRSVWILELIQIEVGEIVEAWSRDPKLTSGVLIERWAWPHMPIRQASGEWRTDLGTQWWRELLMPRFPPQFTNIGVYIYVIGFFIFGFLAGANAWL